MRAAVLESGGKLGVSPVELEDPRPGEVLVKVTNCGVCHSDLSNLDGSFPTPTPTVLGHEAAGVVEAVGPDVTRSRPGDKVVLTPLPSCGRCYFCVRQQPTLCAEYASALFLNTRPDGTSPLSRGGELVYRGLGLGGWAEYVVVPQEGAVTVDDDTDLADACVIGCAVQTGVGAVLNTARVEEGATVAVLGSGGIGIAVIQGARLAGASVIVAVDPVAERREAALRFGATHTVDPADTDVTAFCMDLTTVGMDYCFEAAGQAALIEQGIATARPGRHRGVRRRRAHRPGHQHPHGGRLHRHREEADRLPPRHRQRPAGHPPVPGAGQGGSARPRRHDHRPLPARRRRGRGRQPQGPARHPHVAHHRVTRRFAEVRRRRRRSGYPVVP
jgi:Zn-dependent alcohol dehydrogenase